MGIIATKRWRYRGIPIELILKLKSISNYNNFIETGTYLGKTTKWASKYFNTVFTIEASFEFYKNLNFKKYLNIVSIFGNSIDHLKFTLNECSIIYLDAHYSGGDTYNSYPLLDEIDIINNSNFDHIIIIDDARFCLSLFTDEQYTTISDLCLKFHNIKFHKYIVVFDDMIIITPYKYKNTIDDYTNKISKKYFNDYIFAKNPIKYFFKKLFNAFLV